MPTAPTRVSYAEAGWDGIVSTLSTAAPVSWQTGDVIIVLGLNEGTRTFNTPTATGLTFTVAQSIAGSGSVCGAVGAWAVAAGTSSATVTLTQSSTARFGFGCWVYRGSAGVGTGAKQSTAARTVAYTPAAADSAIVWGVSDFAAAAVQSITPTPTTTDENSQGGGGTTYTRYLADLTDQTSAGAVSYGIGGSGTGPFSIIVMEIKGATGGAIVLPPTSQIIRQAVNRAGTY